MSKMNWARPQFRLQGREHLSTKDERRAVDWRVADPEFWNRWRADKGRMKAAGYRVMRSVDGHWLVSRASRARS